MTVKYKGQTFMTDNDLKVDEFGAIPRRDIQNPKLKKFFQEQFGRGFLGGDEFISYIQSLVSSGMDFGSLEEEILSDMTNSDKPPLKEIIFKKTATGIGRGHSLGGLSAVSIALTGTKMLDSGLTGLVASRSLATSSRRRETTIEEIVVPESLLQREGLLDKYLEISRDIFFVSELFKQKLGESMGKQLFNKLIPYNNPANISMLLSLDTLATLASEVRDDKINGTKFVPRELHSLVDIFFGLTENMGLGVMYNQRINVPRDTYLHYTVFKDPISGNYALESAETRGMSIDPIIIDVHKDFTKNFFLEMAHLRNKFKKTRDINDPEELVDASMKNMIALRGFVGEYNESVRVKIADSLSWRVWSEQKRHATLRQNVESVYSAAERAYGIIKPFWDNIETIYENNLELDSVLIKKIEKAIIIDDRLKNQNELLVPYLYHTARQLMFYRKLTNNGFDERDALYIVPKNIRVRTLENYDLINLINLEFPLRLCSTCEPERYKTSWEKRKIIAEAVPEIEFFLEPKCNIGYCTEGKSCGHVSKLRGGNYSEELHKETKRVILDRAR